MSNLSRKQRKLFKDFWRLNKHKFKGWKKNQVVHVWRDGYTCGNAHYHWGYKGNKPVIKK